MDDVTWWGIAIVLTGGVIVVSILMLRKSMGELTHRLEDERRAYNRATRANQNVLEWLVRTSGITPDHTIFDDEEDHERSA